MVFRASLKRDDIDIVAINDLLDVEHLAYLLKYDSVHGTVDASVEIADGHLVVDGKTVRITAERDPKNLQWDAIGAEIVAECTGILPPWTWRNLTLMAAQKRSLFRLPQKTLPCL